MQKDLNLKKKNEESLDIGEGGTVGIEDIRIGESEMINDENLMQSFTFKHTGDTQGYIYWLGTQGNAEDFKNPHEVNRLRVSSSGMAEGFEESMLTSRLRQKCYTENKKDSWLCIDVGRTRSFIVSHVSLIHGSADPGCNLTKWCIEGYDVDGKEWVRLFDAEASRPQAVLNSPHGTGCWEMSYNTDKKCRYIRIRSTGENNAAGLALPICSMELYGKLYKQA